MPNCFYERTEPFESLRFFPHTVLFSSFSEYLKLLLKSKYLLKISRFATEVLKMVADVVYQIY